MRLWRLVKTLFRKRAIRRANEILDGYEEFYRRLEAGETPGAPPLTCGQAYDVRLRLTLALWGLACDDEAALKKLVAERPDIGNHALDREGGLRNHLEAISQ